MPWIFIVIFIVFSSFFFELSLFFFVLLYFALNELSLNALVTTQKEDRLIAAAPNIGLRVRPNKPAARGMPTTL